MGSNCYNAYKSRIVAVLFFQSVKDRSIAHSCTIVYLLTFGTECPEVPPPHVSFCGTNRTQEESDIDIQMQMALILAQTAVQLMEALESLEE